MTPFVIATAVLLLGAALAISPIPTRARAGASIATQAIATALVLSVALPVLFSGGHLSGHLPWGYPVTRLEMSIDPLGAFFLAWSMPMTLLGSVYALGYLGRAAGLGIHFALLNLTSLSFVMVYANQHALIFLLGWEIAALAAWLLVIWDHKSQRVRFAGFNYLVSTHIGLLFLVAAFMILYTHAGTWEMSSYGVWLSSARGTERNIVFLLLLVSFGLKSAFFPFHSWLPRAHAAAPAHVSALMSGVIHKAGLYALLRFVTLFGRPEEWMGWTLIAFGATSAVIGAVYTATQRDLKRLLGYSSTENVGIAGMGFGVGVLGLARGDASLAAIGFAGGLLHVLGHALFKCLLFYAAGAVYRATHTVDLERLGGLGRAMPWTNALFLCGSLAIAGLPPLNGFASELLVFVALMSAGPAAMIAAATLALVSAVSALSVARAYGVAFLGEPRAPLPHPPREVGLAMRAPMIVHAALAGLLGLAPVLGLAMVVEPTRLALGSLGGGEAALAPARELLGSLGLVAVLVATSIALLYALRRRYLPAPLPPHRTWGCGYTAPSARMQYTGSSFSDALSSLAAGLLHVARREHPPRGIFPGPSKLERHTADAVERRLFEVLGRGEDTVRGLVRFLGVEQPRIAFGALLAALVVIAIVINAQGAA